MRRIVQVSDLHIPSGNELPHGIDPKRSFLSVLQRVKELTPVDEIIITGDIAHGKLDQSICSWVEEQLREVSPQVHGIPGNHDDVELVASRFTPSHPLTDGELYYTWKEHDGYQCIFLDTSSHAVSKNQLIWLQGLLSHCSQAGIQPVLFMHHPPCPTGSLFMDRSYPFMESEEFGEVLQIYTDAIPIFCGHYHGESTVFWKNAVVQVTPSTCFQISPYCSSFILDPVLPGFRLIDVSREGIQTAVLRAASEDNHSDKGSI